MSIQVTSELMLQRSNRHVIGIDVLRFLSAVLVYLLHFRAYGYYSEIYGKVASQSDLGSIAPFPTSLDYSGYIGVQIFFVISGYVISMSTTSYSEGKDFLIARILRLYPSLIVCSTICFFIVLIFKELNTSQAFLAYISTIIPIPFGAKISSVVWTLFVEFIFYIYIYCLFYLKKIELLWVACVLSFASIVFWSIKVVGMVYPPDQGSNLMAELASFSNNRMFNKICRLLAVEHGVYFSTGIIIFEALRVRKINNMLLFILVLNFLCFGANIAENTIFFEEYPRKILFLKDWMYAGFFMSISIAAIWLSSKHNITIQKYLGGLAPIVRWLGLSTYPFYLLHIAFSSLVLSCILPLELGAWAIWIGFAVTLAFSYFVARFVDPSVTKLLKVWIEQFRPKV